MLLIGATGAEGKLSIISNKRKLYDIQKGEILSDGINIKNVRERGLKEEG